MSTSKISVFHRLLIAIAAIALVVSIFVPLWRIELDAPQYPEGLSLSIFPNNIGGDVDIINGLNHYIGMQTLHTENFIEFTILPYIISFFAIIIFSAAIVGSRKYTNFIFVLFLIFGIIAMADFWRWEYNYGHNLDNHAAIKVPGMAYQPPLIGFKQLLNFGAYSVPDIGGWLFILAGIMLLFVVISENNWIHKIFKKNSPNLAMFFGIFMISCGNHEPQPIKLNSDKCDFCKMTISENKYASELITQKGRIYKFDDIACLIGFIQENKEAQNAFYFVSNFKKPGKFINCKSAYFVQSHEFMSPMGGNTAAFSTQFEAEKMANLHHTEILRWEKIKSQR